MTDQPIIYKLAVQGDAAVVDGFNAVTAAMGRSLDASGRMAQGVETAAAAVKRLTTDAADLGRVGAAHAAVADSAGRMAAKATTAAEAVAKLNGTTAATTTAASAQAARFIADLERQAEQIGKTRSELLTLQAAQLGVSDRAAPFIARLRQSELGLDNTGVSAKQTAAALRTLPLQMQDVVASMMGGQNALTVFVQQGGQIVGQFGGVSETLEGLAGYARGLINPFTLAGAAVLGLALAHEQGAAEGRANAAALITSGNAAGVTTGQMKEMAKSVSGAIGTQGAAAEAVAAMAATGAVSAGVMQDAAEAAVRMQRELGVSVADTARNFTDLGRDPLQASLRLNQSTHFLTLSTYEQIHALTEQGLKEEAAAVAQQAYANAMNARTTALADNLGYLQRATRATGDFFKEMWDKALDVGRETTLEEKLKKAQERLGRMQQLQKSGGGAWAYNGGDLAQGIQDKQQEVDTLNETLRLQHRSAQLEKESAAAVDARNAREQLNDQYLDREARKRRDLEKLRNTYIADGKLETEEYRANVAAINQQYDAGVNIVELHNREAVQLEVLQRAHAAVASQRTLGVLNERQALEQNTALDLRAIDIRRAALGAELAIVKTKRDSEAQQAQLSGQIAVLDAQRISRTVQGEREITELKERQARAAAAVYMAQANEFADDQARAIVAESKAREALALAMAGERKALGTQVELDQLELSLMGQSTQTRQVAIAQLRIEQQLRERIDEIKRTTPPDYRDSDTGLPDLARAEQWRQDQIAAATATASKAAAQAQGRVYIDEWQRTSDQISTTLEQGIGQALVNGGKSGTDYIKGALRSLAAKPIQLVFQPITSALTSALTSAPTSTAGATGSGLNALGTAGNLASAYNTFTAAGISSLGGAVSSVGGFFGSSAVSAFGAGMQGSTLAAGLAGPTTAGASGAMGAGASMGSAMSSVAAVAPYMAAALVIANAMGLFKSVSQRGSGLIGSVGDEGVVSQYALMRESGSLFSGPDYWLEYQNANKDVETSINTSVAAMLKSSRAQAATLGLGGNIGHFTATLGSDAIGGGTGATGIDMDGLTAEQAVAKLQTELAKVADTMATQVLGDGGKALAKAGETASTTLQRLSTNLGSVNKTLDTLNAKALQSSLSGASAASALADVFGGIDAFTQTAAGYYQAYYSDAERTATASRQLTASFGELGYVLPANRQQLRGWIDGLIDSGALMNDTGRHTVSGLMSLAGAFAQFTDASESAGTAIRDAGASIREEIARLRGMAVDGTPQGLAALQSKFAVTQAQAQAGSQSARDSLPELSRALSDAYAKTAGSRLDVARFNAGLAGGLEQVLGVKVPGFAAGGDHLGGLRIVGERGPELEFTGPSRIVNAQRTEQLLDSRGGTDPELLAEVRALRAEVAALVSARAARDDEARAEALAMVRNTADLADRLKRLAPEKDSLRVKVIPS